MKLLILCLIFCVGCSFFQPIQPIFDSDCYYESIKYGHGNYEQEQRIYRACMLNKGLF